MLIVFFMTMVLCHAGNLSRQDRATQVDRIELNNYQWAEGCVAQQIILWQWCDVDRKYEATRYFLLGSENNRSLPVRTANHKWRFVQRNPFNPVKTIIIESSEYVVTETDYDVWSQAMIQQGRIAV